MRLRFPNKTVVLWLAAIAVFASRTADAHVHLCLDGQASPTALHAWDDDSECLDETEGPAQSEHNDKDIAVQSVVVVKSSDIQDVGPLPIGAILLLLLPPQRSGADFFVSIDSAQPQHPYLFQPRLRGPPA